MDKMKPQEDEKEAVDNPSLLHDFKQADVGVFPMQKLIIYIVAVVVLGVGSGYLLSRLSAKSSIGGSLTKISGGSVSKGTIVGSNDLSTFKDTAEGILQAGG